MLEVIKDLSSGHNKVIALAGTKVLTNQTIVFTVPHRFHINANLKQSATSIGALFSSAGNKIF